MAMTTSLPLAHLAVITSLPLAHLAIMSPFVDSVETHFGTKDLYSALGVDKSAKISEIRRAYLRLSLKVHPDRVQPEQVDESTKKFQVCGTENQL